MSTELLTRPTTSAVTPRVNLLPPEIAQAAKLRTVKVQLGVGVLATVGVVGLLFVVASGQVSSAEEALASATQATSAANAKVTALNEVPVVYGQVAAAQAQVETAMATDVRWSEFLTDLSIQTPDSVALKSVSVTQTAPNGDPIVGALGSSGIASVQIEGFARTQNDLATYLDKLAKQNNQLDPFFTKATIEQDPVSQRDVLGFSATTVVSGEALSNRYTEGG